MEKKTKTYRSLVAKINWHIDEHSLLAPDYRKWYVGVSNSPRRRRKEHEDAFGFGIQHYAVFYAYTKKTASQVEDFFSKKGTAQALGSRCATEDSHWVYVYKKPLF
ncbi:MAG: hypothetical protein J6X98_10775 [Bacteroidales bacterium]|nr:hypothetical protein [Bacteroidales bacterium]